MPQNLSRTSQPGQITPFTPSLSCAFRLTDDIDRRDAEIIARACGGAVDRILEAGYGLVTPAFLRTLAPAAPTLKKGSIVMPCRDERGEIIALHDHRMQWFTSANVHIANPIRGRWAEIQVCETTSEADSVALAANVCAIGRNGCDRKSVAAAVLAVLRGKGSNEWRLAA